MSDLIEKLDFLHTEYRRKFLEYAEFLQREIELLRPQGVSGEIFDMYREDSPGRIWQGKTLKYIENILQNDIPQKLKIVREKRKNFSCKGCGSCCKFACSEFSPDELEQKAQNGDIFAKEFIETFVPYKTEAEAHKIFPQYTKLLTKQNESGYYFYHCPKVTKDNRCPEYENRPKICRDFPDNPVAFLPELCGYNGWKEFSESIMLQICAMSKILKFYRNNLQKIHGPLL